MLLGCLKCRAIKLRLPKFLLGFYRQSMTIGFRMHDKNPNSTLAPSKSETPVRWSRFKKYHYWLLLIISILIGVILFLFSPQELAARQDEIQMINRVSL
jgi:hypothetical protein